MKTQVITFKAPPQGTRSPVARRLATSDQRPATSDQRPATSDQRPATSDQHTEAEAKLEIFTFEGTPSGTDGLE